MRTKKLVAFIWKTLFITVIILEIRDFKVKITEDCKKKMLVVILFKKTKLDFFFFNKLLKELWVLHGSLKYDKCKDSCILYTKGIKIVVVSLLYLKMNYSLNIFEYTWLYWTHFYTYLLIIIILTLIALLLIFTTTPIISISQMEKGGLEKFNNSLKITELAIGGRIFVYVFLVIVCSLKWLIVDCLFNIRKYFIHTITGTYIHNLQNKITT